MSLNKIKKELSRNVLKQALVNQKYFIIRKGKNIGFTTLKKAKSAQKKGEVIFTLHVGFNGNIYTQKVNCMFCYLKEKKI